MHPIAAFLADSLPVIPLTAWEQAVIIVLVLGFLLVFIGRLASFAKDLKKASDETNKQVQDFLIQRDIQWQNYLSNLRANDYKEQNSRETAFAERNTRVVEATDALASAIRSLVEENRIHNTETRDAIQEMRQKTTPLPKPTPRRKAD